MASLISPSHGQSDAPRGGPCARPFAFWEHSLGCGLVGRFCARKARYQEPERAYLAGLLHDLGELVNMASFQEEFRAAAQLVRSILRS